MALRKMILQSRDLLKLHKAVRTVVTIANNCSDQDVKQSLQQAAGIMLTCVEFVQRLNTISMKRKKKNFTFNPFTPGDPTPDEE